MTLGESDNSVVRAVRVIAGAEDVVDLIHNVAVSLGPYRKLLDGDICREGQVVGDQVQRRALYTVCDRTCEVKTVSVYVSTAG